MIIKSFKKFNEEVSGTELVGPVGPAYGDTKLKNNTINKHHTNVNLASGALNTNSKNDLLDDVFTDDDYEQLLNDFLKAGGQLSELTGDRSNDINIISDFLNND
jgi:hypothetical protein